MSPGSRALYSRLLGPKGVLPVFPQAQHPLFGQSRQDAKGYLGSNAKEPLGLDQRERQAWHLKEFAVDPAQQRFARRHVPAFGGNRRRQMSDSGNEPDVQEIAPLALERARTGHETLLDAQSDRGSQRP